MDTLNKQPIAIANNVVQVQLDQSGCSKTRTLREVCSFGLNRFKDSRWNQIFDWDTVDS